MAASMLEGLKISEEKKKYIAEKLNPVLEEMVTECLSALPGNPVDFMVQYLSKKKGEDASAGGAAGGDEALRKQNEELKAQVANMSAKVGEAGKMLGATQDEKEDEEEEEEEDDDVDEIPDAYVQKAKGARASVSAEAYGAWNQKTEFVAPVIAKTDEQKERLRSCLQKSFLFSELDEKEFAIVLDAMAEVQCEAKDRPINQGDDGDFLFVIEVGTLECYIKNKDSGEETMVKKVEAGDAFGELALLYNCPRMASVEAAEKSTLWKLDRATFNSIVKDAAQKKRDSYEAFLKTVPLLTSMSAYERSQVADGLKSEKFEKGAVIMKENDPGDKFYILEEGKAEASKAGSDTKMTYGPGDYFGELALLRNQPRAATVTSTEATKVLALDRRAFKRLLGPLDSILSKAGEAYK